jgi:hypothetical protein
MGKADYIGSRGEAIAYTRLSEVCRRNDLPFFSPRHLGEKCPTFDFLVDLVDAGPRQLFFFAQVKATREGSTKTHKPPRLKVRIDADDVRRMCSSPAPTYVVGVDEVDERAYIIGIYGRMRDAIPSMTTAHELNCTTLRRLWDEVREYWRNRNMRRKRSSFTN